MSRDDEFQKWYDEYFNCTQGEDSSYSYTDVKMAFYRGFKKGKEELKRGTENSEYTTKAVPITNGIVNYILTGK